MQVDWVSAVFDPSEQLYLSGANVYDTGAYLTLAPGGQLVRRSGAPLMHEGSHANSLQIASRDGQHLYLSGNPGKYFQGHNLFGSADAWGLWLAAGLDVRHHLGLFPGPQTAAANHKCPRLTRVDLTRSYRFGSNALAREWLRDVAASARSRHGGALTTEGTVYWGKHSQRWAFKVYCKADEIASPKKGHRLSPTLPETVCRDLTDWAQGVVRFELMLRSKELAKLPLVWEPLPVWEQYYARLTWNRNADVVEGLDMVDEAKLSAVQAGYLARWRLGEDLRGKLAKPTFYRVRSGLLAAVGVDIASPPPVRHSPAAGAASGASAVLDPAGWDPEPLAAYVYEPDADGALKRSYNLF